MDSNISYMDIPVIDEELLMFQAMQEDQMTSTSNPPAQFEEYAGSKNFYDDYVMDEKGGYVHKVTKSVVSKTAFDNRFFQSMPKDDKGKRPKPSVLCLGMIPTIDRTEYSPDLGEVYEYNGLVVLNSYRKTYKIFNGDHSEAMRRIKKHLKYVLSDEKSEGLMLDWMAWNTQRTGKLKRFAPLIVGRFGDGKSTITAIMGRALGLENVGQISNGAISSTFTGWANSCAVGSIEELKMNGLAKYETYNNLKPYITNEEVEIIRKGKDSITGKNVTNYIAYTNYRDAVPLEEGDRRYWVMNTHALDDDAFSNQSKEYGDHFADIYGNMIDNDIGQVRAALLSHEISEEFIKMIAAPETEAKNQMRAEAMTSGAHAMKERIEYYGEDCIVNGWVDVTLIKEKETPVSNKFDFIYEAIPTGKGMKNAMRELGYKTNKRQGGGKRHVLYK